VSSSAHARYRSRLEALAGAGAPPLLDEAAERWGWAERPAWRRIFERFEPDAEPYATCVFTAGPQRIVRLDAFGDRRFRITRIPPDAGLPTLELALTGARTVVRYHPGRRCTIRVDDAGCVRFAKVYGNRRGERVHTEGVALWRSARRGELWFRVARPGRFDPALRAVWQEGLRGEPISRRLRGPEGEDVARRVGRAAGSLPRSAFRPRAWRDRDSELAHTAARCYELARRVPDLGAETARFIEVLEMAYTGCRPPRLRPVHGALHVSQWLENGQGLALLDYDSLALGDPELDAATFLADLDSENRERVPVDRLSEAFLAGYEDIAGPLDHRLLATYRAQRRLEKALRVARAIRPDGDLKAGRRLRRALACLEEWA
jgi:hypothetical protein